jgi:hypothetical protein
MSEPLQVKVSRDGKEIGTYSALEAIRLLANGTLKGTDFYWHEGMAGWAPLVQLKAFEAQCQLDEKEFREKQENAVRLRIQIKKRDNYFICNCCKDTFEKPKDPRGLFWKGILFIFVGWCAGAVAMGVASYSRFEANLLFVLGLGLVSVTIMVQGVVHVLSSGLRSPYCPGCHSTDYSRPKQGERPVFD